MPDVSETGARIVETIKGFLSRSLAPLEARLVALEERPLPEPGPPGERGADGSNGRDGVDGKDGVGIAGKDGRDGVDGKDGKDGEPGLDGRSITLQEVQDMLEPMLEAQLSIRFDRYVIEHERRLPEILQRMVDAIEKPKDGRDGRDGKDGVDGKDGQDGADGFDLRHFTLSQVDERTLILRFKDLRREISHPVTIPSLIGRGIWNAEKHYQRGDVVTWGGSSFEKVGDGDGKPEDTSKDWRLMVKRGRDGKDGERGEKGETGKAGRNGRDLTQLTHDGRKY